MYFKLGRMGVACFVLGGGLMLARPALAETSDAATRAAARELGSAGVQAFQAGDLATATNKLEAAFSVLRAPSLGLWSARALAKSGKWLEARERYLQVTRLELSGGDLAIQRQAKLDATTEGEGLAQKMPHIVVQVEGAPLSEVSVTLDDEPLPTALIGQSRPVNPGKHALEGVHGRERVTASVTVAESEGPTTVLRFSSPSVASGAAGSSILSATASSAPPLAGDAGAAPDQPRSSAPLQRTLGWVIAGVGGAGVIVGGLSPLR